ncbi:MAG: 16S rRNA (guanine(527)-N(7))-methyltransferase RsmG [Clostridia bacterium]|nr:16S rRNA (guanine(527)-N(7))-methyltransferase RsmG [Clostridia bacterium]
MKKLFNDCGINITEEQLELFEKYYQLLVTYNERFNITAITERQEVFVKHFVDSVIGVDKLKSGQLIDIGSGGGFPAVAIKIMRPDINVTMIEATGKKCTFLEAVIKELNLKNICVINGRAEELSRQEIYREKYDICTARAVARLNVLCEYCMPFVKVGGIFLAYKGNAEEEILEAKNAIEILGGKLNKVDNYTVVDNSRELVYIDKIKPTDKKYPRGRGKERKSPL